MQQDDSSVFDDDEEEDDNTKHTKAQVRKMYSSSRQPSSGHKITEALKVFPSNWDLFLEIFRKKK